MLLYHTLFAFSSLLEKANLYLIPCPLKYLTGYDCPGCGFQRSMLALISGDFKNSFYLYPPAIPILLTIVISLIANYRLGVKSKPLVTVLVMITGSIIMISYAYKLSTLHLHSHL